MNYKEGWKVKKERPEEKYRSPNWYYTKRRVREYASSSHMKKKQRSLAKRVLELLDAEPPAKVLDLGCGTGYSMGLLEELGYEPYGIDIVTKMVKRAKMKGLKAIVGDMRYLKDYYNKGEFDYIVSVSALQWISKDRESVERVREGAYYVLKENAGLGIQFYPKTEKETKRVGNLFKKKFRGDIVIDHPDIPKKRTIYLRMWKG